MFYNKYDYLCVSNKYKSVQNTHTIMIPCLFNLGTGEIIIILVVILLLFGARRIPELARGLGRGVNSFRQGLNEVSDQINSTDSSRQQEKKEDSGK